MQESKAIKFRNKFTTNVNVFMFFFTSYTNITLQYDIYITITSILPKNKNTESDLNTFYYSFPIFQY